MPHRLMLLAVMALAVGCGRDRVTYETPPASSHEAATHDVDTGDTTFSVQGARVTREFFATAQVQPMLGRLFTDADYLSSSGSVAVVSHEVWAERFASVPGIIGESIQIDGKRVVVVGVMPRGFAFPEATHIWTPVQQ